MDMSLRDWLIVVGVLIVIGILADGFRRARKNRRDSEALDQSLTQHLSSHSDEQGGERNPELPNGGARVVRHEPQFEDDRFAAPEPDFDAFQAPQDQPLEPSRSVAPDLSASFEEPQLSAQDSQPQDILESAPADKESKERPSFGFKRTEAKAVPQQLADNESQPQSRAPSQAAVESVAPAKPAATKPVKRAAVSEQVTSKVTAEVERLADRAPAEEVLVINLKIDPQQPYSGAQLLQVLQACDMSFGEMNIFHRFEQAGGFGKVMFSMANGVEPGFFDLDRMDELHTPALSFFMGLPGPSEPMAAFDKMVETVQYLQQELGGELQDEDRNAMRLQTLTHYRELVAEFERRQLMQRRRQS